MNIGDEGKMKEDYQRAMEIFDKARNSDKFCCLEIYSDYYYCWEVKWVYANRKEHKEHRTQCHDTLIEAMIEFESLVE